MRPRPMTAVPHAPPASRGRSRPARAHGDRRRVPHPGTAGAGRGGRDDRAHPPLRVRPRRGAAGRRGGPAVRSPPAPAGQRNAWVLLARVAPELEEWAAFFAAGAAKRSAAEAGLSRAVTIREADDLLRDAECFCDVVEQVLGVLPAAAARPVAGLAWRVASAGGLTRAASRNAESGAEWSRRRSIASRRAGAPSSRSSHTRTTAGENGGW